MSKFIWEMVAFYQSSRKKNKYLDKLSREGKLYVGGQTDWPVSDVYEDDEGFFIVMEVPDIPKDNIEIYVVGKKIIVVGERKFPILNSQRIFYQMERNYGNFKRVFQIPDHVNEKSIQVMFDKGLLIIKMEN